MKTYSISNRTRLEDFITRCCSRRATCKFFQKQAKFCSIQLFSFLTPSLRNFSLLSRELDSCSCIARSERFETENTKKFPSEADRKVFLCFDDKKVIRVASRVWVSPDDQLPSLRFLFRVLVARLDTKRGNATNQRSMLGEEFENISRHAREAE